MSSITQPTPLVPLVSPPINYAAICVAFAETMQAALGLDANHVVQLQPEQPPAPRPTLPFASFMLTNLGQSFGSDALATVDSSATGLLAYTYSGPRMLTATFQFYGSTHEQAYALCSQWHSGLDYDPVQQMLLSLANLSVWQRQPCLDISAAMFTGYEGRASFSCSFGVQAQSTVTMAAIGQVSAVGQAYGQPDQISVTVTDGED